LDNPALGFESLPNWDDDRSPSGHPGSDINSVGGLIGDCLLDLLQTTRTDNNWKAMGALAKMLLQEGSAFPSSLLDLFRQISSKVQPIDIVSLLPESYEIRQNEETEEVFVMYLQDTLAVCEQQIDSSTAISIVDMCLFIIDRILALPLPDNGDQSVMQLGLIVIILVCGHICDRSESLLDCIIEEDCLIARCYEEFVVGRDDDDEDEDDNDEDEASETSASAASS
jgi:hypothetical protein